VEEHPRAEVEDLGVEEYLRAEEENLGTNKQFQGINEVLAGLATGTFKAVRFKKDRMATE
jgi:hypothetical protein